MALARRLHFAGAMDKPLKLHLRVAELPGQTYRVLTLRPSFGARFSNNLFHGTWHLLTDLGGAQVLARLWWGLSYQRQAGTILLVDEPHLSPTPFEADPPAPMLFAIAGEPTRVSLGEEHLIALRRWLRKPPPPTTTVKLQTFGLAAALGADAEEARAAASRELRYAEWDARWAKERMSKRAGFLCYSAPPEVLRSQALTVHRLPAHTYRGSNYHYLADGGGRSRRDYCPPQGEVQIFSDFHERVLAAQQGRRAVVPERSRDRLLDDAERHATWQVAERALAARVAHRRRRSSSSSP